MQDQRQGPKPKARRYDSVLPGEGYRTSQGSDRWVWSNGEMMISRGATKEKSEKNLLQSHFIHHKSHMKLPRPDPETSSISAKTHNSR